MPSPIKILIFPAGSEIAIEVFDALKWQKDVEVIGATSVGDHAEMVYRELECGLPFFNDEGFVTELNEVIDRRHIDFVYPARDDVQLFLVEHQQEIHARVVSAPLETVETCRSKRETYAALAGYPFVPKTYDTVADVPAFPIFGKPSVGEGSRGAQLVSSAEEMERLIASDGDYIFCEYLPGMAWTVDCFTDAKGELSVCVPRTRDRVRSGIAVRSHIEVDEGVNAAIRSIAEAINERFDFDGAWFFQVKDRADGTPILMEVSPRIPGTMGLSRNLGINFPLLTVYQMLGYDLTIPAPLDIPAKLDKAFISRFDLGIEYDTVYLDYDDTIVIKGAVNTQAMAFLYQCKNQGKRIVLLTHHDDEALGELHADMARRGIAESLFDRIVHLLPGEAKTSYMDDERCIFIDDSFRERAEVANALHVPTFDVSNLEALLDWRG